jgi:iron complex transport system permease protein
LNETTSSIPATAAPVAAASDRTAATPAPWLLPALATGLAGVLVAGLAIGAMSISPGSLLALLAFPLGLDLPWTFTAQEAMVVWQIRLPRLLAGALTGAALALGGVLMQALFRNPLADPGLIGVSSGAAAAAALVTVAAPWLAATLPALPLSLALPMGAFAGGATVALIVLRIARRFGHTRMEYLLLAGIAVNALAGAVIGLVMLIANDAQLREVAFWSMGSLGRADATVVGLLALALLPLLLLAPPRAPWLNALLLGDEEAALLGVPVENTKRAALMLTCLAVGAAVAFTGLIGFVGLVAPHLVRLIAGPDHRRLLPAAALLGAILLPLADLIARTVVAPIELPIGLVTALLGAPFFLYLLLRNQRIREAA